MKRPDARIIKIVAGIAAFATLMLSMAGAMILVRLVSGVPLGGAGPDWEIWWVVIAGGIGAGAARLVHDLILSKIGKLGQSHIDKNWKGPHS